MLTENQLQLINSEYFYSGIAFITVSSVCLIITTIQFRTEVDEKDTRLYFVLHSFLTLSECGSIFLFKGNYLERYVNEKVFICVIWVLHSMLRILSFLLFWVQRKLFYRRTALVNNSPRKLEMFENLIAFLSISATCSSAGPTWRRWWRAAGSSTTIVTSKPKRSTATCSWACSTSSASPCSSSCWSRWCHIETGWPPAGGPGSASAPRSMSSSPPCSPSSTCARTQSTTWTCTFHEYLFGRMLTFSQFAPVFYIIAVIVPYDKILQAVCRCRCKDDEFTESA